MKRLLTAIVTILAVSTGFSQNMDSREGDSLALVAIMKANPVNVKWDTTSSISTWNGVNINPSGRVGEFTAVYLSELPMEIGNLKNLTSLTLVNGQLSTLPSEIGNLTNLTTLNLGINNLSTLPSEIGNLTKLETLCLSDNQLSTLPAEFGYLTHLTALALSVNNFTSLPSEIGKLMNLTYLYLSVNNLTSLPSEIGNLTNLVIIDLSNNLLMTLPSEFGNLTKLSDLYLTSNRLVSFPMEITNLPTRYNTININGNYLSITTLDTTIVSWLESLEISNSDGESIWYVPYTSWRTTQKNPATPVTPSATVKSSPITASVFGKELKISGTVPAGSSVAIYDLSGRMVVSGAIAGTSVAIPKLATGVYITRISAGKSSIVQKIAIP